MGILVLSMKIDLGGFTMDKLDCLERALLNTQEAVRDYEMYSKGIQDEEVCTCFKNLAEDEGHHAQQLSELIKKYKGHDFDNSFRD